MKPLPRELSLHYLCKKYSQDITEGEYIFENNEDIQQEITDYLNSQIDDFEITDEVLDYRRSKQKTIRKIQERRYSQAKKAIYEASLTAEPPCLEPISLGLIRYHEPIKPQKKPLVNTLAGSSWMQFL